MSNIELSNAHVTFDLVIVHYSYVICEIETL